MMMHGPHDDAAHVHASTCTRHCCCQHGEEAEEGLLVRRLQKAERMPSSSRSSNTEPSERRAKGDDMDADLGEAFKYKPC
jgi:hypothetical protein